MDELVEKRAFAELLLQMPHEPFKAALQLYPENTNRALWIANTWPSDGLVQAEMARLRELHGPYVGLADKPKLLRAIWERMTSQRLPDGRMVSCTADEFAKLAKLYAEVMGYIEKPTTTAVNVTVPRAIEVPVHQTNESWEQAAARQQRELLEVSRNRY